MILFVFFFFFSSRRRHTRCSRDWSSDVCSSDLVRAWGSPFSAGIRKKPKAKLRQCLDGVPVEMAPRPRSDVGSKGLPVLGQNRDDLGERVEVACVDDLARRMRIAKRPPKRNVRRAVASEDGSIVTAAGNTVLDGNVVFASELDDAIDVFARSDVRIVHRANNEAFANLGIGEAFQFER